jgi:hypothetical protein
VYHELPGLRPARRKAHPERDVVHSKLHEPEEVLAGDALYLGCLVVGASELPLGDAVVPASLLLLKEPDPELCLSLPAAAVFPRRIGLLL